MRVISIIMDNDNIIILIVLLKKLRDREVK